MKRILTFIMACMLVLLCACQNDADTDLKTDTLGYDFTQYLDQEMDAILSDLEAKNVKLQDNPTNDPNLWIAVETINGCECYTFLNFTVYGESSEMRLASYRKQYNLTEEDPNFTNDVFNALLDKLGTPYALGPSSAPLVYEEEGSEYKDEDWDELIAISPIDISVYYGDNMVCNHFFVSANTMEYQEISPESQSLRVEAIGG